MHPYLTQQLAAGRAQDAMRRAEQARVAGAVATRGRRFRFAPIRNTALVARVVKAASREQAPVGQASCQGC